MATAAKAPEQDVATEVVAAEPTPTVDTVKLEKDIIAAVKAMVKGAPEIVQKEAYKRVMSPDGELLLYVRRGKKGLLLQFEVPVKSDDQVEQAVAIARSVAVVRGVAVK